MMTNRYYSCRAAVIRALSITLFAFWGLLLLPGTGCRTVDKTETGAAAATATATPETVVAVPQPGNLLDKATLLDEKPLLASEIAPDNAYALQETAEYVTPARSPQPPEPPRAEFPGSLFKDLKDPDTKMPVKLNFDASPLTEVVPLFAELLKFSYLIDPSVKGSLSMTMDAEMSAREIWEMFEHILWLSGSYASRNPGFLHIMPFAKMPQERRLLTQHEPIANVEVAFITAYRMKSADLISNVKPFMTEGASITDIPRLNTLLIVESPVNLPKLRELIARLDDKGEAAWPQICVRCYSVDAELLQDELLAILPVLGLPATDKNSPGGEIKLTALPRIQVIIASAALPEVLEEVERWIHLLDKENVAEQQNIFFYNVRHSTADHLREAVSVFFNVSGTSSTKTTSKSTSSKAARPGYDAAQNPPAPSSPGSSPSTKGRTAREPGEVTTIFDIPMTIYSDTDQNRLTILTTPRAYAMVEALLKRLDVPPRQVLIQATIADITLNKSTSLGFNYAAKMKIRNNSLNVVLPNTISFNPNTVAAGSITDGAFTSGIPALSNGIGFLFTDPDADRLGFITAVAGETNVKIISTPQIVAANDQEATINIGSKVPTLGQYQSSTTDPAAVNNIYSQSVQYLETGIILKVTPHITAGNEVNLDISQEVSDAVANNLTNIESPIVSKRNLETKLVVPDGGTVLMGGLIKTTVNTTHSGVPWVKDIPLLGRLFRSNSDSHDRTELLVMITVNVIEENTAVEKLAQRYQTALQEIRKQAK